MYYDVIIVGAGPAGSSLAYLLQRKGVKVLLLDKCQFPRDKPCGGGITYRAYSLLENLGMKLSDEIILDKTKSVFLKHIDGPEVVLSQENDVVYMSCRILLDNFLLSCAINEGVSFREKEAIKSIKRSENYVKVATKSGNIFKSRILVGADGALGKVAKLAGIRKTWEKNSFGFAFVYETELNKQEIKKLAGEYKLHMYFGFVKHGYGWIFVKGNVINIGIGAFIHMASNIKEKLNRFLKYIKFPNFDYSKLGGSILPVGGLKRKIVSDNIVLIGDAAGVVDPITGEGIYPSIKSSEIASSVIIGALNESNFSKRYLSKYEKILWEEVLHDQKIAFSFARYFYSYSKSVVESFSNNLRYGKDLLDLVAGKKRYQDLKSYFVKLPLMISMSKLLFKKKF
ncbi:MAG: geranylgeranyl reductase family protein [Candidatus Asgardarchaeum sp.]